VGKAKALRIEAAACRQVARDIKDTASIKMMLERADEMDARAAAIEERARETMRDVRQASEALAPDPLLEQAGTLARLKRSRRGGPRAR
jgi:hypothetical protein